MTPAVALQRIQDSLTQHGDPLQAVEALCPRLLPEAITWARRLPAWDEYANQFTPQVLGIAKVISRRAMTEFKLNFDARGYVRAKEALTGRKDRPPYPTKMFMLTINGHAVEVHYEQDYLRTGERDLFAFVSPGSPSEKDRPHPLSEMGYLVHRASPEAIAAFGSPQAYVLVYAQAKLRGKEKDFVAVFEGNSPEMSKPARRKAVSHSRKEFPSGRELSVEQPVSRQEEPQLVLAI